MARYVDRLLTRMRHRTLLAGLRRRVTAYARGGDAAPVLDEQAVTEAATVTAALPEMDARTRERALGLLAQVHLCRWTALPEPADNPDFFATAYWFSLLRPDDADARVPDQWRPVSRLDGPVEALVAAARELQRRLEVTDHPWAREQQRALWHAAATAVPPDHPERALLSAVIGTGLLGQAGWDPGGPDETEGIALLRTAVALLPADHPDRLPVLGNLVSALSGRFERTGDPADLDELVTDLTEAVEAAPADSPPDFVLRYQLGTALRSRFTRTRRDADLDRAVRIARRLAAGRAPEPKLRKARDLLVATLHDRFEHRLDPEDVKAALTVAREVAAAEDRDGPERAQALVNLGTVCWSAYRRGWDEALLDEAVRVTREAARILPTGHPRRAGVLNSLGEMLRPRAVHAGAAEHLRAAVGAARAGLAATPPGHVDYPRVLSMLGNSLWSSYLHFREDDERDEAIRVLRRAAGAVPPGHPDRAHVLSTLATASSLRAALADPPDRAEVEQALAVHREAIRAVRADSPDRPAILVNFAVSVNSLLELVEDRPTRDNLPAVEEAVAALADALAALPPGRPERIGALMALGRAYWLRFERDRRPEDGEAAATAWREVAGIDGAAVHARVAATRRLARAQADLHGPATAVDAYAAAVELLPLLVWRGLNRADQQRHLSAVSGLAAEAAAAAIAAGRPELAVELSEQARGVLWTQLLQTRTDVGALRAVDADLALEFEQARTALNDLPPGPGLRAGGAGPGLLADPVGQRGAVADRFDAVVARIRALPPTAELPHPERFLRPTPWPELRAVVGDRDVVIVTVSRWRADALVISKSAVRVVELPGLTEERLAHEVWAYLRLDATVAGPGWTADRPGRRDQEPRDIVRPGAGTVLAGHATLSWLWEAVAEPVLEALGRGPVTAGDPPRLWWCPTGLLSLLPLHAAGRHGEPGCSVLDRVVSSYVPTLRALGTAATSAPRPDGDPGMLDPRHDDPGIAGPQPDADPGMLVVALPDTPGQTPLPAVRREQRMLAAMVGAHPHSELLSGPAATRTAVAQALTRHRRVHVSCHGTQDPADPSRGGLFLHDGLLSVTDLLAADRPPGDWIFLSACKTATGGLHTADEAITLSAALSYGGWRHVVGTLWSVDDATAARVAELVYRTYRPDGPSDADIGAHALHRALRQLRDEQPDRPDRWAPFVHLGA